MPHQPPRRKLHPAGQRQKLYRPRIYATSRYTNRDKMRRGKSYWLLAVFVFAAGKAVFAHQRRHLVGSQNTVTLRIVRAYLSPSSFRNGTYRSSCCCAPARRPVTIVVRRTKEIRRTRTVTRRKARLEIVKRNGIGFDSELQAGNEISERKPVNERSEISDARLPFFVFVVPLVGFKTNSPQLPK